MLPNVLAAGRGRSIGIGSPMPHARCRRPSPRARGPWPTGRTGCCSCGGTPRRGRRRRGCRCSSGSGRSSAAAPTRVRSANWLSSVATAAVEGGAGREHLERRARHVPLLVRVGEQWVAWRVLQFGDDVLGDVVVGVGERVRVERRVAVHRADGAGLRFDHGDRAVLSAEEELGGALDVVAHGEFHGPGRIGAAGQQVAEPADLLFGGRPVSTSPYILSTWVEPNANVK